MRRCSNGCLRELMQALRVENIPPVLKRRQHLPYHPIGHTERTLTLSSTCQNIARTASTTARTNHFANGFPARFVVGFFVGMVVVVVMDFCGEEDARLPGRGLAMIVADGGELIFGERARFSGPCRTTETRVSRPMTRTILGI